MRPPDAGLLGVLLEETRQETLDLIYGYLLSYDRWPASLDVERDLLSGNKIDLRSSMFDAGWLFPVEDVSNLTGVVRLTFAGLCLATSEEARADATFVLRFVRAVGRLALRPGRMQMSDGMIAAEMGEALSGHRLLLCETTLAGLGGTFSGSAVDGSPWSVAWSDRLMRLATIDTADSLLVRAFGIGVAEYQRRHFPSTRGVAAPILAHDARLLRMFRRALPYERSIHFLKDNNVAGFSFDPSRLDDLSDFRREWGDAAHRFRHPLLERGRRFLHVTIGQYLGYVGLWTFPVHNGRQTVPAEWETEQPLRFRWVVDEMHRMAGEIVHWHQQLISVAAALD